MVDSSSQVISSTMRVNKRPGKINTGSVEAEHLAKQSSYKKSHYPPLTPSTAPPTPESTTTTHRTPRTLSLRGDSDLRSPGIAKTPASQDNGESPLADFITQTDQYGRATSPRSQSAISAARADVDCTTEEVERDTVDVDPCDTLLESLRMMCCCLLPDPNASGLTDKAANTSSDNDTNSTSSTAISPDRKVNCYNSPLKLLPSPHPHDKGKKCLVLDLDETLVHSSFRAVQGADFVIPVQIDTTTHYVYVAKRPGVDKFLLEMAKHYEIVVYTASLNKYADPLLDLLDPHQTIRMRLFRESCVYYEGNYVKDLSLLDRDLSQAIIVDNSPSSYIFHPDNAIDCTSFIDDPMDLELDQIGSFLKGVRHVKDVRKVCSMWREWPHIPRVDEKLFYPHEDVEDLSEEKQQ